MLSVLILVPLCMALLLLFIPARWNAVFKWATIVAGGVQLVVLYTVWRAFAPPTMGEPFQLVEQVPWFHIQLPSGSIFRSDYLVGVDGLSLPLVMLTVVVMLIAAISSLNISKNTKGYSILFLLLNGAIVGTFCALDFLVFYLFFEFSLIPLYFLIGMWGGPKREYASIKFLLYTLIGSLFILITFIGLYVSYHQTASTGGTLYMQLLDNLSYTLKGSLLALDSTAMLGWFTYREWAFLLILIGFLIKLPAVPFHTWLPDAHVEAPTPVSVVLASLLLKVGGYGLLRFVYPIFPDEAATFTTFVSVLAVASIVYGGLNALASKDLKRLIAYSSVSHMGFVLLGIASATTEGAAGAIYQLVSHGILSALLFLLVGVLYDRTQDRMIGNYSGLSDMMPGFTAFVLIAFFASMGLPGFSGFIAEVMVLFGAFGAAHMSGWVAVISATGLVLAAAYFLWTIQRMFYGPKDIKSSRPIPDLTLREYIMLVPLAFLTLLLGLWPRWLLDIINPYVIEWVDQVVKYGTP